MGLAVASLVPVIASAQTVDEIVAKHLAARGGAGKIAAIESLRMTAKARAEGGREAIVVRDQASRPHPPGVHGAGRDRRLRPRR
jgi:hypothetical protein